jgi:hypothetical protein
MTHSQVYADGFRAGRQFETWHPGAADPAEIRDALAAPDMSTSPQRGGSPAEPFTAGNGCRSSHAPGSPVNAEGRAPERQARPSAKPSAT